MDEQGASKGSREQTNSVRNGPEITMDQKSRDQLASHKSQSRK